MDLRMTHTTISPVIPMAFNDFYIFETERTESEVTENKVTETEHKPEPKPEAEPTEPKPEPTEPVIPKEDPKPTEPPKQEPPKNDNSNETRYYDVPLSNDLQRYIFNLCEKNNIDSALVIAMIDQESDFRSGCIGDNGDALGLMQIQPKWHQDRMDRLGCQDLLDPYQNVKVGIDFLAELYGRGKPTEWVLMAYNGGAAYANRKWNNGVISSYANKVLSIRDNLEFKD